MPHSDDYREWTDEIPDLYDLNGRGGRPGLTYLYCDSAHELDAQQAGWVRIEKSPVLSLTGPRGTCPFVVMTQGTPALTLVPERATAPIMVSQHLLEATGLGMDDLDPIVTVPVEALTAPAPTARVPEALPSSRPAFPSVSVSAPAVE